MTCWHDALADLDPRARAAGAIALVVAINQPFYPLYLHAIAGASAMGAWLTLLSTPFFAAVPAIARRHSLIGRAMLPLVGVANTMLGVKLLGTASAVELFLLPCILLAALLFRPGERVVMVPAVLAPVTAYLIADGILGPPLHEFSVEEYRSMIALHAASVGALTALIGLQFSAALSVRGA